MKRLLIPLVTILCLLGSATVPANGNRHHGYYGGHSGYNQYRHHKYRSHHYRPHYYRHRGHGYQGHHSDEGAYLLGGLLIGAVLTDSYHRAQYNRAYPPERQVIYRTRIVETRTRPSPDLVAPGRHLFRDLEGNCFEIHRNEEGDELRSELPAGDCDW